MKKRIGSLLLSLALCLSLLPTTALATETPAQHTDHCVCGKTTHATVKWLDGVEHRRFPTHQEGLLLPDGGCDDHQPLDACERHGPLPERAQHHSRIG